MLEAGWLAGLGLVPVIVNPYSSRAFDPAKAALLRWLVLFMAAAWLVRPAGVAASVRRCAVRNPLALPALAWIAANCLSTATSVAPIVSVVGGHTRGQGLVMEVSYVILFLLVAESLRNWRQLDRAVTTMLVASVPVALYAIFQHYGFDRWSPLTRQEVSSTLGGSTFLGGYLVMVAPFTLARLLDSVRRRVAWHANFRAISGYALLVTMQSTALVFATSRGPFAGLLAAFLTFALLDLWARNARRLRRAAIAAVAGMLLVLVATLVAPRLMDPGGGSTRVRLLLWQATIRLVLPHIPLWSPISGPDRFNGVRPLIGYGPESLYASLTQFYPPELQRLEPRSRADRAHNALLDAFAETGLFGTAAYLALIAGIAGLGVNVLRATAGRGRSPAAPGAQQEILVPLLAGLVGHLVETQVGIPTTTTRLYFWFFAGALVALHRMAGHGAGDGVPSRSVGADDATETAIHSMLTGLICASLVFALVTGPVRSALDVLVPSALVFGTVALATILVGERLGSAPFIRDALADAARFSTVALGVAAAATVAHVQLVTRGSAGSIIAYRFAVSFFVLFVLVGVLVAARALNDGTARRAYSWPQRTARCALAAGVTILVVADVARINGEVITNVGPALTDDLGREIAMLDHARRLQPFADEPLVRVGQGYLALAARGEPQPALREAEASFLRAREISPFDSEHTLRLAQLHRAAAQIMAIHDRTSRPNAAGQSVGVGATDEETELQKALVYYDEAVRLDPSRQAVRDERATVLTEQTRARERKERSSRSPGAKAPRASPPEHP